MEIYEHSFNHVEKYLHHRPPYLLVDRILSIDTSKVVTEKTIRGDEFFISGHFPGAPIVPGAMMQELTTQTAGVLIAARYNPMPEFDTSDPFFNEYALGVLVKVNQARYKGFARPGDTLVATVCLQEQVSGIFDFSAQVTLADQTIMRNSFQLTNIKSSVLQGK
ncbi:MAG: beta-hydroxyacyl-ACP dehydratase [Pirellulaceae bacterium]|nr:beta-hydroxyacyl-ACP dehydratase [Pirellulaceae bacterium]